MLALICSFPAKMVLFREFINCLGIYQLVLSQSSDSAVSGLFGFISEAEDGHVKSECCSKFIGFLFRYVNCSVDLLLCLCVWFKHILFRRNGLCVAYNVTMPSSRTVVHFMHESKLPVCQIRNFNH